MAPHESQARNNHGQTLERLAQRGGLSPCEAWCVINGTDYFALEKQGQASQATGWWGAFAATENARVSDAVAAERERCAKVKDALHDDADIDRMDPIYWQGYVQCLYDYQQAIRKRQP